MQSLCKLLSCSFVHDRNRLSLARVLLNEIRSYISHLVYGKIIHTVIPEINAVFYKCEHCEAFYTRIVYKRYSFMDTITGIYQ